MSSERWERLQQAFEKLLAAKPEEREDILNEVCDGDVELRDEVLSLVKHDKEAPAPFLDIAAITADEGALKATIYPKQSANSSPAYGSDGRASRPPVSIPNHELVRRLGSGGFGEVWMARNTSTLHYRACKLILKAKSIELDAIRRLKTTVPDHPNLFPIEDVGEVGDWLYCLMPLAENVTSTIPSLDPAAYRALTLETHLRRHAPLPPKEVGEIGMQLAAGLAHLHSHDVTHGDVKPANVMRINGRWTLSDYSLLRDLTDPCGGGHTPGYVPPEGPGTAKADQFALGVVLCEMLSNWKPIQIREFMNGEFGQPIKTDEVGHALSAVASRAMDEKPESRFGSVREMREAIERAVNPADGPAPGRQWRPFKWRRLAIATAIIACCATIIAAVVHQSRPVRVESFNIRHFAPIKSKSNENLHEFRGNIGAESLATTFDDDVVIEGTLSSPAYFYLLALIPDGRIIPCLPVYNDRAAIPPRMKEFVYPSGKSFYLKDAVGTQGFLLLVSTTPLPSWNDWTSIHGEPEWSPDESTADNVWEFVDGHLSPAHLDRGEGPLRGDPPPIRNIIDWASRVPELAETMRLMTFPVRPRAEQP